MKKTIVCEIFIFILFGKSLFCFTSSEENNFKVDLKYFQKCDFHLTANLTEDKLEFLLQTHQYMQPWSVYNYPQSDEVQNMVNNITWIRKEVCDVNILVHPTSHEQLRDTFWNFRGFRENSYFLIFYKRIVKNEINLFNSEHLKFCTFFPLI